ncbi:MAG: VWA domain-containing protein, partial [Acidobacteriota bacterium]|nr:VWA domain-containing protein [Acidobacteriota bacterium]
MAPDMRHDKIEDARRAFLRFAGRASRQNEYFLWAFNKRVIELTDWTQDAATLGKGLGEIAPGARPTKGAGSTAIYDACAAALQKLAGAHQRKRVLLVVTDGGPDDGASHELLKTLKRKVRESGALVYFVAMMDREWPGSLDAQGQEELNEIAKVSGGRAYFPLVWDELNNIIDRIAIELNSQYAISFTPTNAAKKGELNRLTIKVKPQPDFKGKLYVRAREGYVSAPE